MAKTDTNPSKRVFVIAQELEVIRMLSGNDEKAKNKALKNLNKWLLTRSKTMPFTEEDLRRIWKGLYYCMWMSDKPLNQEECADKISKLVHFPDIFTSLLFFKAGFYILSQEWSGIQQLRLDKFLMLVRRLLRQTFIALKHNKYSKEGVKRFCEILSDGVLSKSNDTPIGLFMHFVEIFLEELAKVSLGKLQADLVLEFIKPFVECLAHSNDGRKISHVRKFIFTYLIRQSKLGAEYQDKYEAWRQQGFPGHIDSMQKIKIDSSNDDEQEIDIDRNDRALDPRAGRVDVEIPRLKFTPRDVAAALSAHRFDPDTSAQSRVMIKTLSKQFASLANGVYPLGVKKIDADDGYINVRKAATALIKYDRKISGSKIDKRKRDKENETRIDCDSTTPAKRIKSSDVSKDSSSDVGGKGGRKAEKTDAAKRKIKGDAIKAKIKLKSNDVATRTREKSVKRSKRVEERLANVDCIFKRNSGTWVVYDLEKSENIAKSPKSLKLVKDDFTPAKSSEQDGTGDFEETEMSVSVRSSPNRSADNRFSESLLSADDAPKLGTSPVKLFATPPPSSPDATDLFKKSPWDAPLQDGEYEYEICVPSKRRIDDHRQPKTRIKGKSTRSISRSASEPFRTPDGRSIGAKKVKINTKLNKSQEVFEHYSSVLSSPGIPFDADRRPAKPLLKPFAVSTPINPFYKKQLSF